MSSSEQDMQQQVTELVKATGEELSDKYYETTSALLCELGFSALTNDVPVPLELWKGVAQAVADYSGFSVILNAAVTELISEQLEPSRTLCRISG